jgi:hypothetical protein
VATSPLLFMVCVGSTALLKQLHLLEGSILDKHLALAVARPLFDCHTALVQ